MNLFSSIWFFAQNPISNYWHKATDRTFSGIYHVNAFDLMMMIPYFIVLIILAVVPVACAVLGLYGLIRGLAG